MGYLRHIHYDLDAGHVSPNSSFECDGDGSVRFAGSKGKDLSEAETLQGAIAKLEIAVREEILDKNVDFAFVVFDIREFHAQLVRECRFKNIVLPEFLQFPALYSILDEYIKWQGSHAEAMSVSGCSVADMCAALSIKLHRSEKEPIVSVMDSGPTYDTIEQGELLLSIVKKLLQSRNSTNGLFTVATDYGKDLRAFLQEESKILYLSGLAYDTTQSELEGWFTQHGGRPIAFWTLRTPDQHKSIGTGYAIFSTHDEARESLSMNGLSLADRVIQISPSSSRVLDRAAEILTPFPPSKNRPRPGDWTCPSCSFSNFQRRTACFRCSYPSNSKLEPMSYYPMQPMLNATASYPGQPPIQSAHIRQAVGGGHGGHVPFRAGDWSCQTCAYHNFARNNFA